MNLSASAAAHQTPGRRAQHGLSLIELMVALALGLLLTVGVIQVFGSIRASFTAAGSLSRLQEEARFAGQFLREDVQSAGFLGCSRLNNAYGLLSVFNRLSVLPAALPAPPTPNWHIWPEARARVALFEPAPGSPPYVAQVHRPIEVYDYKNTSPGDTLATPLQASPSGVTNSADFLPALPSRLVSTAPDLGSNGLLGNEVGDLVPGSDVLVVRMLQPSRDLLNFNGGVLDQGIDLGAGWTWRGTDGWANLNTLLPPWTLWGVVQCSQGMTLMQINGASPRAAPTGSGTLNQWDEWTACPVCASIWPGSPPSYRQASADVDAARLYRYQYVLYHVGRTADGPPALYRRRLIQNPSNANEAIQFGPPEELVRGVEMMQILVGVDDEHEDPACAFTAAAPATPAARDARVQQCTNDDVVDRLRSPSQHLPATLSADEVFKRQLAIRSVRISLLVRGEDRMPPGSVPPPAPMLVGDVRVTPPDDGRLRHVYQTTLAVRNRIAN